MRPAHELLASNSYWNIEMDPNGRYVLAATAGSGAQIVDLESGSVRKLEGFNSAMWGIAVSSDGSRVAGGGGPYGEASDRHIRLWDLESGDVQVLDAGADTYGNRTGMFFLSEDELLVAGGPWANAGIRIWDLRNGEYRSIRDESVFRAVLSPDGRSLLFIHWPYDNRIVGPLMILDMETQETRELPDYGEVASVAFAPDGRIVAGGADGRIYVGDLDGNAPHLLLGHTRGVGGIDVSPDGDWIASASTDGTVRLWPMPEGAPLHELPYGELMNRLRAITNLRVVKDVESPNGYRLGIDGFDGWAKQPAW